MLEGIANFLISIFESSGFFGIFIATFLESFFAPIPSEIVLLTAGFFATTSGGYPILIIYCVIGAFGNFFGTLPFYLISRYGSERFLKRVIQKFGMYLLISYKDIEKSEKFFTNRGAFTVFFARLIPGIRSVIAFPAGIVKMNFFRYSIFTIAGSFVWNLVIGTLGFLSYERKEVFIAIFEPFSNIILIGIVILVVVYILRVIYNIKKLKALS